jgi:hypothetical protein
MGLSVSLAFKEYSNDKLLSFSNTVYQMMSGDVKYASLKSYIDDTKVKTDAFISGIALAARRDTGLIADRNNLREILLKHLVKVARQLEDLAEENDDDPRIIMDAGFEVRGTNKTSKFAKRTVTALDTPVVEAKNIENKPGFATVKCKRVKNAINYAFLYRILDEPVWQNGTYDSTGEYTFTNLESRKVYEFQIIAQGTNGLASGASAPVAIFVS